MKLAVRGKYLVTEHAVELRRIIPALPIVAAADGFLRSQGVSETARTPGATCVVDVTERVRPRAWR
jgi:hypothetical protein